MIDFTKEVYLSQKFFYVGDAGCKIKNQTSVTWLKIRFELIDSDTQYIDDIISEKLKDIRIFRDAVNIVHLNNANLVFEVYVEKSNYRKMKYGVNHE